jgi:hypothetical protein
MLLRVSADPAPPPTFLVTIHLPQPIWERFQQLSDKWAATILADDAPPPLPEQLKGLTFFGDTAEEAEQQAAAFLAQSASAN